MYSMGALQREAWEIAEEKGFHEGRTRDGRDDTLLRLCLIHTEVSEAAQEVKKRFPQTGSPTADVRMAVGQELADIIIRVFDLAESLDLSMEWYVRHKMDANRLRPKFYGTAKAETAPIGASES